MRSICPTLPSKYFRSDTMTSSQSPRALRSRTRKSFTTVKSPDMFDLTNRFLLLVSIDCDTPQMLEIVAVGAMANTFEFRMPVFLTFFRKRSQSRVDERSRSRPPRASARSWIESIGRIPFDHNDPSKLGYCPRSEARSLDASIAWNEIASMLRSAKLTAESEAIGIRCSCSDS